MGEKRSKTRISCSIDDLPEMLKNWVDAKLTNPKNTYQYISDYLKQQGEEISRSSIGRYAIRSNKTTARLIAAQEQTRKLVQIVQNNPTADYTEAGMMMLMDGLINKLATAEEEFDSLPIDKAGRLIASIARTKVYKDRVKQDMQKKTDLAFKEMEAGIMKSIKLDPESVASLKEILSKARERMVDDD